MSVSGAMPIATAVAAVVLLIVLELQQLGRPGRSVWPYLLPVGSVPLVGAVVAFKHLAQQQPSALTVVATSAMCSVVVTSSAALIFATHAASYASGSSSSGVAHRALLGGMSVLALFAILFRREDGMLIAAVPAGVGVLCTWIGARSFSPERSRQQRSSKAAILTLLAISLALGAVAAACIAAACAVLSAPSRASADALRTLGRMTAFALAPLTGGAIAFGKRADIVGLGARGRIKELVATISVLFLSAAGLRVALAGVVKARAHAPSAVRVVLAPVRMAVTASAAIEPSVEPPETAAVAATPAPSAEEPSESNAAEPGTAVEFGEVTVSGPLYPGEVQKGVQKARPYIEKCQQRIEETGRIGRMIVKFSIGVDGSVTQVLEDDGTEITNKKFIGCVLASFYQIGFPAPSKGNVRVEAPIRLR